MPKQNRHRPIIMAIETSCDETSAALMAGGHEVLSNIVATQFDVHAKYGGVVPELASRAHIENIDGVLQEALRQAGLAPAQIDAIAVTSRPGLVGSLLIGLTAAKTLSLAWGKPLLAVNHLHAHACSAAIDLDEGTIPWPAVALVVSGGHTSLMLVHDPLDIRLLGSTIDDAAGEAFDKVASILNLGFPGGPAIQRAAEQGNCSAWDFPRTMLDRDSLDFSFSGIKTAVLYHVHGPGKTTGGLEKLTPKDLADIAASFEQAVVDVLVAKTILAVEKTATHTVMVGGGVAANQRLRRVLSEACHRRNINLLLTPMRYCTDNGAMIAAMGTHLYEAGRFADLSIEPMATAME